MKKNNFERELFSIGSNRTSGRPAGLQVKVSRNGWDYVLPDLLHKRYEVPLVYFDLSNDFYRLKDEVHTRSRQGELHIDLERDFLHGKTIDSDVHDRLLYFAPLVTALIKGEITINSLVDVEAVTALIVSSLEKRGVTPFVVTQ